MATRRPYPEGGGGLFVGASFVRDPPVSTANDGDDEDDENEAVGVRQPGPF